MSMRASAGRYARALLDVAIKESSPDQAERELTVFTDLVQRHSDLQAALANPAVPVARKRAVVERLVEQMKPSAPVGKLLLLLADRGRLALIPDVLDVYRERLMEHQRVVRAEVTTAAPLPPERLAELQSRLASATGRTIAMTTKVDPSIIGGVVTRIGSTVFDGSVATQLAALKQHLAES